jgi:hypothetical protein
MSRLVLDMIEEEERARLAAVKAGYEAELTKVRQERDAALVDAERLKIQRDTVTERAWIMRRELLLAAEVLTGCGCSETAEECKRAAGEPTP